MNISQHFAKDIQVLLYFITNNKKIECQNTKKINDKKEH